MKDEELFKKAIKIARDNWEIASTELTADILRLCDEVAAAEREACIADVLGVEHARDWFDPHEALSAAVTAMRARGEGGE